MVQIPRHTKLPIHLEVKYPVKIYRFLTDANDNSIFDDWDVSTVQVEVIGGSCTHTNVVYKEFNAGIIILHLGGNVASSPILIKQSTDIPVDSILINGRLRIGTYGNATY